MNVFVHSQYGYTFTSMAGIKWFVNFIVDKVVNKLNGGNMEINDSQKTFCECIIHQDEDGNNGVMPVYSTSEAACADLTVPKQVVIPAHSIVKVDMLISFNIKQDMKVLMYPRSSLMVKRNLIQPVSVIDPDYHDHVHVPLYNPTGVDIILERGERVAQIECVPRYRNCTWVEKDIKREGGFGSTGK